MCYAPSLKERFRGAIDAPSKLKGVPDITCPALLLSLWEQRLMGHECACELSGMLHLADLHVFVRGRVALS